MKKFLISILIGVMLVSSVSATEYADVKEADHFYDEVLFASDKGIINGIGNNLYNPQGILTVAEGIKISACINASFYGKEIIPYDNSTHWADAYYDYALENGIIKKTDFVKADFDTAITRDRLFYIFANTLPDSEYIAINEAELAPEKTMSDYVEKLFCAGIVIGSENGFELDNNIIRADSVILISRMCAYSRRQMVLE